MATKYFHTLKHSDIIVLQKSDDFETSEEKLSPGVYELGTLTTGLFSRSFTFKPLPQRDKLIKFKSGIVSDVLNKVGRFFSKKTADIYKELKIFHSTGILFYGPHGTGKTCTCQLIMEDIAEKYDAICLVCTGYGISFIKDALKALRTIQKNPIVVFVDEAEDAIMSEENAYLSFLDGTDSVDKMLYMGCTNLLDKISKRIKFRKSRIKHLYEIKAFPLEVYKEYVIDRLPSLSSENVAKFAFIAEERGLTLDQLKHSIIDFRVEGVSIEEAITGVLEEMPMHDKKVSDIETLIDSAFNTDDDDLEDNPEKDESGEEDDKP